MKKSQSFELFSHITYVDRLLFTKHLSTMLKSGITVFQAVDILSKQARSKALKTVLIAIRKDLENGQSLAKALAHHPKAFNSFYDSLIEVGEASGTLEKNLEYLASQLVKEYAFRKKIQNALFYPTLVLVFAVVVGFTLSIFVLPKLIDLFKDLDVQLPLTTQLLLWFSQIMKDYGIFIGIGTVIFIFLIKTLVTIPSIKPTWHAFLLSFPLFGRIMVNAQLTAMCRNIGIMIQSGLPLRQALEIQHANTPNVIFKKYINHLQLSTNKGKSLSDELDTVQFKHVPIIMVKMIGVGEKTGKLDEVLLYLADFFEEEVDDDTKNISTVLEPILLLIIGVIVAFVALAIISPIYQFTGSIRK